jgi:transcriptional regulator with XRE-family HTH domain
MSLTDAAPLDDVLRGVGSRIRSTRRDRGLTLAELADRCGLSVSMLSTVERGRTSPSVATLYAVASALDTSLTALFSSDTGSDPVVRREDQQQLTTDGGSRRRLALDLVEEQFELYVDEYPAASAHAARASQHPGHEYGVVLTGRLVVRLGEEEHVLQAGDAVHYPTDQPHQIRNDAGRPATAVWVNTRRTR